MILRGGYNIYPRELEEVMMTHPAVSLVAVIGVPCDRMGEEVKAFVVKKAGRRIIRTGIFRLVQSAVCQLINIRASSNFADELPDRRHGQNFQTRPARNSGVKSR